MIRESQNDGKDLYSINQNHEAIAGKFSLSQLYQKAKHSGDIAAPDHHISPIGP